MFREGALHKVQAEPACPAFCKVESLCKARPDDFDFEPLWYWCALRSLTQKQLEGAYEGGWASVSQQVQDKLLLLHHEEAPLESNPYSSARILAETLVPGTDPVLVEKLTQIWVLNCFEYTDDPEGFCTYFFSSFMSHSCVPNAFWHYDGDDHVLRAREDITLGDEVCISYLSEDWLLRSAPERRWDLFETKRFWCECPRCVGGPDLCRGFLCCGCGAGGVFAPTPASGPAKQQGPPSLDLLGVACDACGRTVTELEAEHMEKFEKSAADLVKSFADAPVQPQVLDQSQLQWMEENLPAVLGQHWLVDLAWEKVAEACPSPQRNGVHTPVLVGDASRQMSLLRWRCAFHAKSYPGLNNQHAASLVTLGDFLSLLARQSGAAGSPESEQAALEAAQLYAEAHQITSQMFGARHDHTVAIESKGKLLKVRTQAAAVEKKHRQ